MSLARNRSSPESRLRSQPDRRAAMEFLGHCGSSAGVAGLLVVPRANYQDLDVDFDDEDEDIVIGIRPKSSPQPRRKTSVDEEDSDISEPPSLSGSRRVSFADAVGLSLVKIKEFDKWDVPQLPDYFDSISKDQQEYFILPFNFTQSSSEEIAVKVIDQKIELESIELLPGTTILKGVIRVLNISFTKAVYVRTSLDNWVSHFDLLAEYIPGSSKGHTDSFSFKLTLVPSFTEQGARVDFCLRYETECGTFWANNSNKNFVLFCHKRKKDVQDKPPKESAKKSCLKTSSPSFSVEESMSSLEQESDAADLTTQQNSNNGRRSKQSPTCSAERTEEDGNGTQVENRRNQSRRNRRKAAKAAQILDYFTQKELTTQDSAAQPSPVTQTERTQGRNIEGRHSDCKDSIHLEDNAETSSPNDSNSKQHEKLNLTDVAISTDNSPDNNKDQPNTAPVPHEKINKYVSSCYEERSPEPASDCTRPAGGSVDSERLVSDSSGFEFGTVVAPLYHQVSCRVGGQPHSETCCSASTNDQRAGDRSPELNDCKDVKKAESIGQVKAVLDIGMPKEAKELENITERRANDSKLVEQIIADPNPMKTLDCNVLNSSGEVLNVERQLNARGLTSDNQVSRAHEAGQSQLVEKTNSHSCTITAPLDREKQPYQNHSLSRSCDPILENNVKIVASSQKYTFTQRGNTDLKLQTSLNDSWNMVESSGNVTDELSLEFVGKNIDSSGKPQSENESILLQPSQHESMVNQTGDASEVSSENLENEKIPQCGVQEPLTNPNYFTQEKDLESDNAPTTASSCQACNTTEHGHQSLLLEQIWTKIESTNTADLINEADQADDTSVVKITTTAEDTPQMKFQLRENYHLVDDPSMSKVSKDQALSVSLTSDTAEAVSVLELSEDLGNASNQEPCKYVPMSQLQETEGCVVDSSSLLGQSNDVQVCPTSRIDLLSNAEPKLFENYYSENLFDNDDFTHPDELNADHNEKMTESPQHHGVAGDQLFSLPKQVSQTDVLSEQQDNSSDPHFLLLGPNSCNTMVLSHCYQSLSLTKENSDFPIELSDNNSICLENQPLITGDIEAQPYKTHKTIPLIPKKESGNSMLNIKENSEFFKEAIEERELPTRKMVFEEEISPSDTDGFDKSITMINFGDVTESKKENNSCCTETSLFATDNVKEISLTGDFEPCAILFQTTSFDINTEDEAITCETMIDKEKEVIHGFLLQSKKKEDIIDPIHSNLADTATLQVSNLKVDLESPEKLDKVNVLSFKTKQELEKAQEGKAKNEVCFDKQFETEILGLGTDGEVSESVCAKKMAKIDKKIDENIANQIVSDLNNFTAPENATVHPTEKEKVKILDEEDTSMILPHKAKPSLSPPMASVQEGIESYRVKIEQENSNRPSESDDIHFACRSKDWSEDASPGYLSMLAEMKCEQMSDHDGSNSETDSGSDDEMELYMHCVRAVYGQQSSPKATKPETNGEKEAKRPSITRSKHSYTSLPSISESLDEEQQSIIEEKNPERVEVQYPAPVLPDSNHNEENVRFVWWKDIFSCRNILKTLLHTTLVLVFLAVAYHYDFIACFGLYVISVIWLLFQEEKRKQKS